ncbi:hypothetical protein HSACCH_00797 [Halanaerobium saccharolyticum subsp. saccharolyticum DSM 6643]|uniref:Uncharacterized protein n=1 Tax=Halanaerobium saccharolyticum subsp. saccharolyticum DSM 6643 TaxID=1293054 RepID=M5DYI0_9FIRM|nr:hypothetical protein HSACCH_00797 [Halanaerobium saccharolyticum subsp. saccharolyticum DSM 6643]
MLISAAVVLKDKKEADEYLWALLLLRRAFIILKLKLGGI